MPAPKDYSEISRKWEPATAWAQAFEHVEFFWLTWMEMLRIRKPGGRIFLIAPSREPEHRYPQGANRPVSRRRDTEVANGQGRIAARIAAGPRRLRTWWRRR